MYRRDQMLRVLIVICHQLSFYYHYRLVQLPNQVQMLRSTPFVAITFLPWLITDKNKNCVYFAQCYASCSMFRQMFYNYVDNDHLNCCFATILMRKPWMKVNYFVVGKFNIVSIIMMVLLGLLTKHFRVLVEI